MVTLRCSIYLSSSIPRPGKAIHLLAPIAVISYSPFATDNALANVASSTYVELAQSPTSPIRQKLPHRKLTYPLRTK